MKNLPSVEALLDSWFPTTPALHLVPAPAKQRPPLRFLWNGIKGPDGKLQGCHYSFTAAWSNGHQSYPTHITIYHNSHCGSFSGDVAAAFDGEIENHTDSQTDYFTNDHITINLDHPLFEQVAQGCIAQDEHRARHADKMAAKRRGRPNGDNYRKTVATLRALLAK